MNNPKTFGELVKHLDRKYPHWMAVIQTRDDDGTLNISTVGRSNAKGGGCSCCIHIYDDEKVIKAEWYGYDSSMHLVEEYSYAPNHT